MPLWSRFRILLYYTQRDRHLAASHFHSNKPHPELSVAALPSSAFSARGICALISTKSTSSFRQPVLYSSSIVDAQEKINFAKWGRLCRMYLRSDAMSSLEYSSPPLISRCRVSSNISRENGDEHNFHQRFSAYKQNSLAPNVFIGKFYSLLYYQQFKDFHGLHSLDPYWIYPWMIKVGLNTRLGGFK